jgi:hypothetical protein
MRLCTLSFTTALGLTTAATREIRHTVGGPELTCSEKYLRRHPAIAVHNQLPQANVRRPNFCWHLRLFPPYITIPPEVL